MPDDLRLSWSERISGRLQQPRPSATDDYDLQIDQQALSLIQIKQQLTYFLITGSTGVIAFVVAFTGGQSSGWPRASALPTIVPLTVLAVAGLAVSGFCLLQLYLGNRSFTLHVRYRTDRKVWSQLTPGEQQEWKDITNWGNRCLTAALALLFLEVLATLVYFWLFVHQLAGD